jgi:choline dehydrogenase
MSRTLLHVLAATPALAWTQPRFGYVPGNDYGVPRNASYDYVIVGGGTLLTYLNVPF